VVALIKERWSKKERFDGILWGFLQSIPNWNSDILELAQLVLSRTGIASYAFEYVVGTLGAEQPEKALALVVSKLDFELSKVEAEANLGKDKSPDDTDMGGASPI